MPKPKKKKKRKAKKPTDYRKDAFASAAMGAYR